jgi:hypothetical protein
MLQRQLPAAAMAATSQYYILSLLNCPLPCVRCWPHSGEATLRNRTPFQRLSSNKPLTLLLPSPVSSLDLSRTAAWLQPQHCIVVGPSAALQPLPMLRIPQPHGSLPAGAAAVAAAATELHKLLQVCHCTAKVLNCHVCISPPL